MPFVTEEIWSAVSDSGKPLMLSEYPQFDESLCFEKEEQDFEKIIAAIRAVRNRRSEMNVVPSVKAAVYIETAEKDVFEAGKMFIERLAWASSVTVGDSFDMPDAVTAVTHNARIFIPLDDLIDREKEIARLEKEKKAAQKDIDFSSGKLNNPGFISKAPAAQIENERAKLAKAEEKMANILKSIEALKK